ncbi:cytochrome C2 [Veillonella montpellierensis DNF00314]|uniref:Meso-diaminopimelate D-dehydrogenase n=1 Tax=Veillonella montpellierensis DNF00314 TaxID=1401067 RepID=A0A096AJT1_9FIRM|nr:diaminopimelate dehydrogenase [Veillonella montpellierensis]KGF46861.1 cytochrome C2 [Veillonella montpellierensis DNF00314]
MSIKIGIVGYGNLARGVETSLHLQKDMELVAIFSRRSGITSVSGVPVYGMDELLTFKGKIDVMILCGGSATDLMEQTPMVAKHFNCIDSFDTHAKIPEHFANVDKVAKANGHTAIISCGWDPGMFSLNRVYAESILPQGTSYTFWGRGVSQGHSDAIRRIDGVLDARQYTCPKENLLDEIRHGQTPTVDAYTGHTRECYVVASDGADKQKIEQSIKTMKNYFVGYETTVHFISQEELDTHHKGIPHGGFVLRSGETKKGTRHVIEYSLTLDSNPEFTGAVLVAYSRGLYRLANHGGKGAYTVFDIAPAWLSPHSAEELRAHSL